MRDVFVSIFGILTGLAGVIFMSFGFCAFALIPAGLAGTGTGLATGAVFFSSTAFLAGAAAGLGAGLTAAAFLGAAFFAAAFLGAAFFAAAFLGAAFFAVAIVL